MNILFTMLKMHFTFINCHKCTGFQFKIEMLIESCDNHLIIKQIHMEGFPASVCPIFLFRLMKNKNPCISWKKKSYRIWIKISNTSDQVSTINKKYMQAMNLDITSPTSNFLLWNKIQPKIRLKSDLKAIITHTSSLLNSVSLYHYIFLWYE